MSETIEPGSLLPRYLAGEHEAVWRDMARLRADVRTLPYFDDAWAVACETMRRARCNVELIVRRLDAMGYAFWNGERGSLAPPGMAMSIGGRVVTFDSPMAMMRERAPAIMARQGGASAQLLGSMMGMFEALQARQSAEREERLVQQARISDHLEDPKVFCPPAAEDLAMVRGLEAKGLFLPLSWRAWIETVGQVNLAGEHPALSFWEAPGFPGVYSDPLMVTLDHLAFVAEGWEEDHDAGEDAGELDVLLGWDPKLKARLAHHDELLDEGYEMVLPNAGADGVLSLGGERQDFVDYLRKAFRWGGFPGWEGQAAAPRRELAQLTEGLLPL